MTWKEFKVDLHSVDFYIIISHTTSSTSSYHCDGIKIREDVTQNVGHQYFSFLAVKLKVRSLLLTNRDIMRAKCGKPAPKATCKLNGFFDIPKADLLSRIREATGLTRQKEEPPGLEVVRDMSLVDGTNNEDAPLPAAGRMNDGADKATKNTDDGEDATTCAAGVAALIDDELSEIERAKVEATKGVKLARAVQELEKRETAETDAATEQLKLNKNDYSATTKHELNYEFSINLLKDRKDPTTKMDATRGVEDERKSMIPSTRKGRRCICFHLELKYLTGVLHGQVREGRISPTGRKSTGELHEFKSEP